eukprot:CAMPEP_0172542596 /NCGR_PEP_ID=MMETSP1067-20121228/13174_1 /TAXON_ID=265564 ORGANISM="Thalassiosira punctigera, Strain Tpunct2005C2" /NCGR_SAMPLE_ID=MMETSP1067 /ASSEMBLY_ACC=CAM_ASM_000444 /LENGTH=31 /DNA_ID= /DNA_START= /DNA_END= /DNA_ORIENTATION=
MPAASSARSFPGASVKAIGLLCRRSKVGWRL